MPRQDPSWQCRWRFADGQQCTRKGVGRPPYCREHFHQMYYGDGSGRTDFAEDKQRAVGADMIDAFLQVPLVGELFKRFAEGLEYEVLRPPPRPRQARGGGYYAEWPPRPPEPEQQARDPGNPFDDGRRRPHNGYSAPPPQAPPAPMPENPRVVLGFAQDEPLDEAKIKQRRRAFATIVHPDKGGNNEAMRRINAAAEALLAEVASQPG